MKNHGPEEVVQRRRHRSLSEADFHPTAARIPKYLPFDSTRLGAGSGFGIFFSGTSIPGGGLMLNDLKFFDNVGAARGWHKHLVLRPIRPSARLPGKRSNSTAIW